MGIRNKSRKEKSGATKRGRKSGPAKTPAPRFNRDQWVISGIFVVFTILAIVICFVGLSPMGPQISPDQTSRVRIVAEFPFTYESEILTTQRQEERQQRIPPVYRIAMEPFEEFRDSLWQLQTLLHDLADDPVLGASIEDMRFTREEIEQVLSQHDPGNTYFFSPDDLYLLANDLTLERLGEVFSEGLAILESLYREGIVDEEELQLRNGSGRLSFFHVRRDTGHVSEVEPLTREEALRGLRINLSALALPREVSIALFRFFRNGLKANLVFDREETERAVAQAVEAVPRVQVSVSQGDSIIEPGTRVTPLQYEQLSVYREHLRDQREAGWTTVNPLLVEQSVLAILVVLAAAFYVRLLNGTLHRHLRTLALSALVLLLNLALIRLALELAASELAGLTWTYALSLPWLAPVALGPILLSILVGAGPGILAAALIGIFSSLMQGGTIGIFVVSFIAAVAGIQATRGIQLRTRVVRAGVIAGVFMAMGAIILGLRDSLEITTIGAQTAVALAGGAITGIAVIGLLPVLEQLFRYTTNITLLELTDFNHPLLRKLQIAAPGSYHHSLMVANLSENAAAAIGANPLVCRVCSFFHDIGKMVKPEYFSENQRDGYNPHIERNPSMSALIIKAHVKEGVAMARQHKLPRIIVDVIKEHHGTTLIQYFYYKAIENQRRSTPPVHPNAPRVELDKVNEDTYRYEGPNPHFAESAIIALADSVEAASRSLRKVNLQNIEDLVDKIFQSRISDGQLSNSPLTLKQLEAIRKSFIFTLLNMLHVRVEYPDQESKATPRPVGLRAPAPPPPPELHGRYVQPDSDTPESLSEEPSNSPSTDDSDAPERGRE